MSALAPSIRPLRGLDPRQTFDEWWEWTRRHAAELRDDRVATAPRAAWRSEIGIFASWVAERVAQMEPRRMTPVVLDAGCGNGAHALLFAALGAETHGIDHRPERIATASRAGAAWSAAHERPVDLTFERGDVAREWNRRYDAIWFHDVIGEAEDPDAMLVQARAHLAPGGVLGVAEWNGAPPAGPARHPRPVTSARSLRSRLEAHGFQIALHAFPWGCDLPVSDGVFDRCVAAPLHGWWPGRVLARRQIALVTGR